MSTPSPPADEPASGAGAPGGPGATAAAPTAPTAPTAADYYAVHRGGGLFSEAVSQRLGARLSVLAYRWGLAPTVLTVANLAVGTLVSAAVIVLAEPVADGRLWAWPVGLLALLGWQLAYALDCADGQLARVTGQSSPAGARVDVLCDVAAQIALVAALAAVAAAQNPDTPAWLLAAFAGTWMVNLVTSVLQRGPQAASLIASGRPLVRVVKLVRDYGAVVAAAGLALTVAPHWTVWLVGVFTLVNAGFLAASIAYAGRAALRS